jgi:hypothetical protein
MENPIIDWIERDEKLSNALQEIDDLEKSPLQSAKIGLYKISELYNLPKMPEDITDEMANEHEQLGIEEPHSVFEEMAIINFMASKEDDIRGLVLSALHNVYFKTYIDINDAAILHYGSEEKIPLSYQVYFLGSDINAIISFETEVGKSWVEAGACMMKEIKRTVSFN